MAEYKVKLVMSEEYNIEANSSEDAEEIARGKFGNNYLIDDVVIEKVEKKIKTVSPAEFFTAWNEMEKHWINEDDKDYVEKILEQDINIELPLLGIKTKLYWCPITVEVINYLYQRMVEEEFELIVEKEKCYYTSGGICVAEVPFEYEDENLVMVVDNEHTDIWAVYENVPKDNGKWDSVEYDELLVHSMDANHIFPDYQIYYIRALQLLAERNG